MRAKELVQAIIGSKGFVLEDITKKVEDLLLSVLERLAVVGDQIENASFVI